MTTSVLPTLAFPDQVNSARLAFVRPVLGQGPKSASPEEQTQLGQLHALFSDAAVAKFCGFVAHEQLESTRAKLASMVEDWQTGRAYSYLIYRRDDPSRLIGNQYVKPQGGRLNLGCAFIQDQWRQGFALEATRFWVNWGLKQPSIWRVEAFCDAEHPASVGVMEQAGMQFEGRLRRFFQQPELGQAPRDVLMYAAVRQD